MKKTREEILKEIGELDNLELLENISDSWEETLVNQDDLLKEKNDLEVKLNELQTNYDDLKLRYKERFFTNEEPPKDTNKSENLGLHQKTYIDCKNIFKEVTKNA